METGIFLFDSKKVDIILNSIYMDICKIHCVNANASARVCVCRMSSGYYFVSFIQFVRHEWKFFGLHNKQNADYE